MSKEKTKFKALIDTIEVSTDINNLKDFTKVNNDRFDYVDRIRDDFDNSKMTIKLNPHTKYGEGVIDKLHKHNEVMNEMMIEIGVRNNDNVNMNRIDIAFDTNSYDFNKGVKKLMFMYELLTIRDSKKGSDWFTINRKTLQMNTMKYHSRTFELEVYNKKEESKGTHPYNVRVEFRYKRRSLDISNSDTYINKTIDKIKGMEGQLEHLEENMSERLIKLWEVEKENVKSFSEFVRKYNDYFYTLNILKEVYKGVGLTGSYSNWIKDFRKTNNIEFYSKSDIKTLQKAILKSAKEYLKVDKKPSKTKEESKDIEISDKEILKELDLL